MILDTLKAIKQHQDNNAMFDSLSTFAEQAQTEVSDMDIAEFTTAMYNIRAKALAVVLVLADNILSNDLDDDEAPSERLDALMSEYVDDDIVYSVLVAHMQDVMYSLGVDEVLASEVFEFSERQDEAIEAMADIINANVPDDDELDEWRKEFVYGEPDDFEDDEAVQLDSMMLDGMKKKPKKMSVGKTTVKKGKFGNITYKAVKAVRNGKVVTVNKRVSGHIQLSAKQKSALKKAGLKAHTGQAIRKQMKSLSVGVDKNIYTNMAKAKRMQGLSLERHNKALRAGRY